MVQVSLKVGLDEQFFKHFPLRYCVTKSSVFHMGL